MKLKLLFASILPFSLLIACGGTSDALPPESSSDGKEGACAKYCESLSSCDGVNIKECTESCTKNRGVSRAGQEAINSCTTESLCSDSESEVETAGASSFLCLLGAASKIDPSEAAQTYCDTSVSSINTCLDNGPSENDILPCKTVIGIASDELLDSLNQCATQDCSKVEVCVGIELLKEIPPGLLTGNASPSPEDLGSIIAIGVVASQLSIDTDGRLGDLLDISGDSASEGNTRNDVTEPTPDPNPNPGPSPGLGGAPSN